MVEGMRTVDRIVVGAALLVLLACSTAATAATGVGYSACLPAGDATAIFASGASCDDARSLAVALAAAPATAPAISAVLGAAGWAPLRAAAATDGSAYDLIVTRGRAAVSLRRSGLAPDLDGWAAGRELIFAHQPLVSGRIVRAAACTSGFLIRIGARLAGLSAAHCGGLRHDGRTQRANVGLLRRPQPGIVLGRVVRNLERTKPLDALVVPVPVAVDRPASPVVDRGVLSPPWFVTGTAAPYPGLPVCMTGQTSGPDQCGRIAGASALPAERLFRHLTGKVLRCTTIVARPGDSGGPVYTAPAADGTVQAVGVATLVITGLIARLYGVHMCFTPIAPVLDALGAQLVTAG
jgi:hypothetical protein